MAAVDRVLQLHLDPYEDALQVESICLAATEIVLPHGYTTPWFLSYFATLMRHRALALDAMGYSWGSQLVRQDTNVSTSLLLHTGAPPCIPWAEGKTTFLHWEGKFRAAALPKQKINLFHTSWASACMGMMCVRYVKGHKGTSKGG
jgi:hypothetical protein